MEKELVSKEEFTMLSKISLTLSSYDDIFSDFDPRKYSERSLSDDFLEELGRASKDKNSGNIELRFLIPASKRNITEEQLIKRRLREHFKKHYLLSLQEYKNTKKTGFFMAFLGIFFIVIAAAISSFLEESFLIHLIVIILEPAGWFTAWTGMDQLFYTTKEKKPKLDFNEKMSNAEMSFLSY